MTKKILISAFIILISLPVYSQSYQSEKDSLTTLKNSLTTENANLKSEVDSLTSYLSELDKKLDVNQNELSELKNKLFIKKYGKEDGKRMALGKIWKGMTLEMLEDEWGRPDKSHTDKHPWGVFTQLYYGDITYFFKNSILTDWEEGSKK